MTWRHWLQVKTRSPAFLWRMVIGVLLGGVILGVAADYALPAWAPRPDEAPAEGDPPDPLRPESVDLNVLADQGRWLELVWAIPGLLVDRWREPGAMTLAVLTGLCWLAFAVQAIQIRGRRDARAWMPFVALGLGVLSIWPTLFLIIWQEHAWDLADAPDLAGGVRYYVLGVGLREELAKLLCYLPLLPIVVRRRDDLAALVVPGCVGLGFAMAENIDYIQASVDGTLARLLMPPPLHMAMTGLVGLAAYRACVWPRQCGPQFIALFGVVVLAHGLYDSFLALPALAEYNIASGVIFILLIYQFFRELRPAQQRQMDPVSLTANFLFCVSMVAAATFVYLSAAAGWRAAADMLGGAIVTQGVMAYLFLREMPETMVRV